MQEIKFTPHKQYLFGLIFSIKSKKTHTDHTALKGFLLCPNQNGSPIVAAAKKRLFRVYVRDPTCFGECLSFHNITERGYFF